MAYAGSNNFSKKVAAQSQPSGANKQQYSAVAGSAGCKGEPSGTGGLGRGSISKLGNAKKG